MFDINQLQQMMMQQAQQSGGLQTLAPGALPSYSADPLGRRVAAANAAAQSAASPGLAPAGLGTPGAGVPGLAGAGMPGGAAPTLDAVSLAKRAARRRMEQQALAGAGVQPSTFGANPMQQAAQGVVQNRVQQPQAARNAVQAAQQQPQVSPLSTGNNPWASLMQPKGGRRGSNGGGGAPSMAPRQRNSNPLGGPSL